MEANSNNIDQFIDEVSQPTRPAIEVNLPNAETPPPGANIPPPPPPTQPYTPPPGAEPIFKPQPVNLPDGEEETEEPTAQPKLSKAYADQVIAGLVNAEDYFTSLVCTLITGVDDRNVFAASDDDKKTLAVMLEPFKDVIAQKLPAYVPLLLVYGGMKTSQFVAARKMWKANKENEQAKEAPEVKQAFNKAANEPVVRGSFKLGPDGFYRNTPKGAYVKRDGTMNADLEKPLIRDIKAILAANDVALVAKAFNLTPEELEAYQ